MRTALTLAAALLVLSIGPRSAQAATVPASDKAVFRTASRPVAACLRDYHTVTSDLIQVNQQIDAGATTLDVTSLGSDGLTMRSDCGRAYRATKKLQFPPGHKHDLARRARKEMVADFFNMATAGGYLYIFAVDYNRGNSDAAASDMAKARRYMQAAEDHSNALLFLLPPTPSATSTPRPTPSPTPSATSTPGTPWLTVNAGAHTATVTLVAGATNALGGFNFNGYGNGQMVMTIPVGSVVTVIFTNKSAIPHSAVITAYSNRMSTSVMTPAFSGANTPNPTSGTPNGQTVSFTFVASTVGTYAIVCGVPGHAVAGMWDVLKVT